MHQIYKIVICCSRQKVVKIAILIHCFQDIFSWRKNCPWRTITKGFLIVFCISKGTYLGQENILLCCSSSMVRKGLLCSLTCNIEHIYWLTENVRATQEKYLLSKHFANVNIDRFAIKTMAKLGCRLTKGGSS